MPYRRHICAVAAIAIFLQASPGYRAARAAEPARVLLIYNSVGYAELITENIRADLQRRSPKLLETYLAPIPAARFADESVSATYAGYLRALFPDQRLELAVAIGSPAMEFFRDRGRHVFPSTPMLAIVEQNRAPSSLGSNETVVTSFLDLAGAVENILQVLPETTNISVVIGTSPLEQYWSAKERLAFQAFAGRISFRWLNDLSFEEILRHAAKLPPRSAILFNSLFSDASGGVYDDSVVVSKLHADAKAPIFSFDVSNLGNGTVGGPWPSIDEVSRDYADVALRILAGEPLGGRNIPGIGRAAPKFDWREMQRWGISESRLPPGSTIFFRDPTAWELYRWQIATAAILILLQAGVIIALFYEHRRRRNAEVETRLRMAELAHMNRCATAGEMSASIAHELRQPLSAILCNAEALELMLNATSPDLREIKQIAADIRKDDERASEVLQRLRSLVRKGAFEPRDINLTETVSEVFAFTSVVARGVVLRCVPSPQPLCVRGDRIQLQQVILNLVVNGIDAMDGQPKVQRQITGRIRRKDGAAEVSISDSGPGIPADRLGRVFDPFFTTKNDGMGMGLSIARTIVEAHGGRIWVENEIHGGAIFRVSLPLSGSVRADEVQSAEV
jgi:signal transduction histidine kinase